MKRSSFVFLIFLIFLLALYAMTYIHEWTHGTIAYFTSYKSSPFNIYYGKWFNVLNVNEAIDYQKIFSDGKPYLVAAIAIAPILLQMILFPIALKFLQLKKIQKKFFWFAFFYFFTLLNLSEIYSYIPIRTFAKSDDIFHFLLATSLTAWPIALIGTVYVILGASLFFTKAIPQAFVSLQINTKWGRFAFLLFTLAILLVYFGGIGFTKPDGISHFFSRISWLIFLATAIIMAIKTKRARI